MEHSLQRLPKYVKIKDTIRHEIETGVLQFGDQLPSETDLTKRFQSSKMTVIRALQDLVQEGYLQRIQGKGTYITRPSQCNRLIGLLIPKTNQGIYSHLVPAIERKANQLGYGVALCSSNDDIEFIKAFAQRMIDQKASGIIAIPPERLKNPQDNLRWYEMFHVHGIPVIFIDRSITGVENTVLVSTNNEEAMFSLTCEIKAFGHRRLLLAVDAGLVLTTKSDRIRGFRNAALQEPKADLAEVIEIAHEKTFAETLHDFEMQLVEHKPTMILTGHDLLAVRIQSMLLYSDLEMARKISMAGFDDLDVSAGMGLTTVRQPLKQIGETGVEMLHRKLSGESAESVVIPSQVIVRNSVSALVR